MFFDLCSCKVIVCLWNIRIFLGIMVIGRKSLNSEYVKKKNKSFSKDDGFSYFRIFKFEIFLFICVLDKFRK